MKDKSAGPCSGPQEWRPGPLAGMPEWGSETVTNGATEKQSENQSLAQRSLEVNSAAVSSAVDALPDPKKLRRSGRIRKEIAIVLFGSDLDGSTFTEQTKTVVLSLHGAGIVSKYRLLPEQELVLRWEEAEREADVRVVGEVAQEGIYHTYGVAFLDERLDFWRMEFPFAQEQPERPAVLLLECGTCGDVVELVNGEFEYDICAIHGGLTRFCVDCGMLTVWRVPQDLGALAERRAKRRVLPRPVEQPRHGTYGGSIDLEIDRGFGIGAGKRPSRVVEEQLQLPGVPAEEAVVVPVAEMESPERRSRVRAKVNFLACVRSELFAEEVVKCIDMAKGGVSFRSKNPHVKNSVIQIAVPFSPEDQKLPAIFVRARVANVRELPDEGIFRCGVGFLR
jgi:hypothetical protein